VLVNDTESRTLESAHRLQVSHTTDFSASFTRYSTVGAACATISFGRSKSATIGTQTIVANNDALGQIRFLGTDGISYRRAAEITGTVDGVLGQTAGTFVVGTEYRILTTGTTDFTLIGAADSEPDTIFTATDVGTGTGTAIRTAGDMPGRLVFSTTPDNTGAPVERMRIRSDGNIGLGGGGAVDTSFRNQKPITGNITAYANLTFATVQSDVTLNSFSYRSLIGTAAQAFTLANIEHFRASQGTLGAGSTVTNQYGFSADSSLIGATNNYGFYSNIPSATGRWNFYANNTAPNFFNGDVRSNKVVTTRAVPVNSNVTATATAASLLDGLRTGTPTANIDLQLPTGTNMDEAFQELQSNQAFEWSAINLATAASGFDITVTANTDHTVVGRMVVTGETSGRFLTRKTAANTFITYRIA
jgi:hypothetical protein